MPPKAGTKSKGKGKAQEGPTPQEYVDAVRAGVLTTAEGKVLKRAEAIIKIWSLALEGEDDREELFKAGVAPVVQAVLERGDDEERHAAVGAISALVRSEKHYLEVVNTKVILAAAVILTSDHDRGKLPATQLLCFCASRAELAARVADNALPALVETIKSDGLPGWGQMRQAQRNAAVALKLLIENVEGEPAEAKMMRRLQAVQLGVVPPLVRMVSYLPRLPPPPVVPAPPPAVGKKRSAAKGKKKESNMPLGTKDTAATVAAACLRFLALAPEFVGELLRSGHVQDFVQALLSAGDEQAAYIAGVLWEVTAEDEVGADIVAAGGVPALLHVISKNLSSAKSGKKSSQGEVTKDQAKQAAAKDTKRRATDQKPTEPPCFPDIAVCNAAGALHHLTFLDPAKQQLAAAGGVPILTACLKLSNAQTYENATGALWNVGLDVRNNLMLMAAGAPDFVAKPVPERWLTRGESSLGHQHQQHQGVEAAVGDGVFMTQAGMTALHL